MGIWNWLFGKRTRSTTAKARKLIVRMKGTFTVRGQLLDGDQSPCAKATIFVVKTWRTSFLKKVVLGRVEYDGFGDCLNPQGVTDSNGKFSITLPSQSWNNGDSFGLCISIDTGNDLRNGHASDTPGGTPTEFGPYKIGFMIDVGHVYYSEEASTTGQSRPSTVVSKPSDMRNYGEFERELKRIESEICRKQVCVGLEPRSLGIVKPDQFESIYVELTVFDAAAFGPQGAAWEDITALLNNKLNPLGVQLSASHYGHGESSHSCFYSIGLIS